MANPSESATGITSPATGASRTSLYVLLLAVETAGAALLYWHALPIYRLLSTDPAAFEPQFDSFVWTVVASGLIQASYWTQYRVHLPPPRLVNPLLGHIVLLFSQLSFVLATAVFSFLFITKKLERHLSYSQYAGVLLALFSLFCYQRELRALGNRLLGRARDHR